MAERSAAELAEVVAASGAGNLRDGGSDARRDIDMVAVPWTDEACDADALAQHIAEDLHKYGVSYETAWDAATFTREEKPHGRIAWSIPVKWKFHTGGGMYLDLSVAPKAAALSAGRATPPHTETDK